MSAVYLDACAVIYLVEGAEALQKAVGERLAELAREGPLRLLTSRLSRLECRVVPLRDSDIRRLESYDSFFAADGLELVELGPDVIETATRLRARHGLKTPDALHLAAALESGASVFLTGDADLRRCAEVNAEVLAVPSGTD